MSSFSRLLSLALAASFFLSSAAICRAQVRQYSLKVVAEYPHDPEAYTQGLFFKADTLCESTGQWGKSGFRKVDLETGKVFSRLNFSRKYFGEGSAVLDGRLYVLTWTSKVAFVYDAESLKFIKGYSYPREGWGLTTDGNSLIASDGSSTLYWLDGDLRLLRSVNVRLGGRSVRYLNELEWIDGRIWANVYMTDTVLIINPDSGAVEGVVDCGGLLPAKLRTERTDVLNGIARNPADGRIYLTGKNWPRLYEVKIVEK